MERTMGQPLTKEERRELVVSARRLWAAIKNRDEYLTLENAALLDEVKRLKVMLDAICHAVAADLGPLDEKRSCLCDAELDGLTCSVCLAHQWLEK
jgi:hypothetical protein